MTPTGRYKGPRPIALLVLDGWGIGPDNPGNAIKRARTPNLNKYWLSYAHTQLEASGQAVGLPQNEDGNTETGHLNIGAGHIVYQDLPRINMAIADGSFYTNQAFLNAVAHVKNFNSTLHLMGLVGAGGVHSNIEHLYALLNFCKQQEVHRVYIHGFTDGRDSPPTSGASYVQQVIDQCNKIGIGQVATLMGRFFAMDRDKRWERIQKAYNALTLGDGQQCTTDIVGAMQQQYDQGITDEFIEPICICNEDGSHRVIQDNDAAIFFNYRIDRPRELTRAFVMPDFEQGVTHAAFDPYTEKYEKTNIQSETTSPTFQRTKVINNFYFVTMTNYEDGLPVDIAFPPQNVKSPIGKVFADYGLRQLRITETEKERFVTYYMNGQREDIFPGEQRVIIPSKGVKSYDQAPEMSAFEIADEMIKRLKTDTVDVVIANICNGDMVGHTGNLEAAIRACEVVDEVVGKIVTQILLLGGVVFITADHGNVEEMINSRSGEVDTEHSIYPVPFLIIGKQFERPGMIPSGILADVAPTILKVMGIEKPPSMTGRALV
ncbi:2,3-bisphosphoglycerate-independent phosphoglycerate mutase [Candidatus Woesebacteria bacterium]|nr:2,3-bisphosphoglycerate-independent phosphoglycerate mutase [Candidatus Woesebacteria bacterium]